MSCCGQKRRQWQQQMTHAQSAPTIPEPVLENPVLLQYHGSHSHMIKGTATGLLYLFAANGKSLEVDSRDVTSLLKDENFSLL
jgi:hypothetical protein